MWIVTANPEEQRRRSIYMFSRRTFRPAMFESFDAPDGIRTCSRREVEQYGPAILDAAEWQMDHGGIAETRRIDSTERLGRLRMIVKQVWRAILGRDPDDAELARGRAFLQQQTSELGSTKAAASELVRALFNTNEFLYVD